MPYIKVDKRKLLWEGVCYPITAGELNYMVSMHYIKKDEFREQPEFRTALIGLLKDYIRIKGVSYQTFNDIAGVVSCVQKEMLCRSHYKHLFNGILRNEFEELYHDTIFPYEQTKCKENGDIFV